MKDLYEEINARVKNADAAIQQIASDFQENSKKKTELEAIYELRKADVLIIHIYICI